jgi:GNAT superfamily N-acetyltransferase
MKTPSIPRKLKPARQGPFDRVRVLYRALGLKKLLARLVRRGMTATSSVLYVKHTELLIEKDLDDGIVCPLPDGLQVEAITTRHRSSIERFNERYRSKREARASVCYLKHGYRGFIALVNDEPIGYWWWVGKEASPALTHPCVERFELDLKDDEVYAFDYFIAPEYRRFGTGVKCLSLMYLELYKMGYRKVWAFVDAGNPGARWVYQAHGNKVVKRIISHEVLSLLLFQDCRIFIRNMRWSSTHQFDQRLLLSLKTAPERAGARCLPLPRP